MHTLCPRATTKNEKYRLGVNRGYEMKLFIWLIEKKSGKINRDKNRNEWKTNSKRLDLNPLMPVITVDVNALRTQFKDRDC